MMEVVDVIDSSLPLIGRYAAPNPLGHSRHSATRPVALRRPRA